MELPFHFSLAHGTSSLPAELATFQFEYPNVDSNARAVIQLPIDDERSLFVHACLFPSRVKVESNAGPYYAFLHGDTQNKEMVSLESLGKSLKESGVALLLNHGGYFHGAVFVQGKCVLHKSIRRYVTRRGQGKKQSKHMGQKGSGKCRSAGGRLRAFNETKHKDEIGELLDQWQEALEKCRIILLGSPGNNKEVFLTHRVLQPLERKIKNVPLTIFRPTLAECERIYEKLMTVKVDVKKDEFEGKYDEDEEDENDKQKSKRRSDSSFGSSGEEEEEEFESEEEQEENE